MLKLSSRLFATATTKHSISTAYNEMVAAGKIRADRNQIAVVEFLDNWTEGFYKH
jgi:hypothetical protein